MFSVNRSSARWCMHLIYLAEKRSKPVISRSEVVRTLSALLSAVGHATNVWYIEKPR